MKKTLFCSGLGSLSLLAVFCGGCQDRVSSSSDASSATAPINAMAVTPGAGASTTNGMGNSTNGSSGTAGTYNASSTSSSMPGAPNVEPAGTRDSNSTGAMNNSASTSSNSPSSRQP